MKSEGIKLKELLAQNGMTGRDLATALNMSRSAVYYYFDQEKIKKRTIEKFTATASLLRQCDCLHVLHCIAGYIPA